MQIRIFKRWQSRLKFNCLNLSKYRTFLDPLLWKLFFTHLGPFVAGWMPGQYSCWGWKWGVKWCSKTWGKSTIEGTILRAKTFVCQTPLKLGGEKIFAATSKKFKVLNWLFEIQIIAISCFLYFVQKCSNICLEGGLMVISVRRYNFMMRYKEELYFFWRCSIYFPYRRMKRMRWISEG